MAVYTPNLQLVRYEGETPRKLWEIKARSVPTLTKGDLVLLDATMAVLMVKKHGFVMADNSKLLFLDGEPKENFAGETLDDTTKDGDDTTKEGDDTTKDGDDTTKEGDDTTKDGDDTTKDGDDTTQNEEYKLPLASAISELSDEELKAACKYVGLPTNKKVDTLRGLLLPYLPQE